MALRVETVNVDTTDPARVAPFWRDALGWVLRVETADEWVVAPPEEGSRTDLLFARVPEERTGRDRLRLVLRADDPAGETARLVGLGATYVGSLPSGAVLADPDGNELRVLGAGVGGGA